MMTEDIGTRDVAMSHQGRSISLLLVCFFNALTSSENTRAGACPGTKLHGDATASAFGNSMAAGPDYMAIGAPGDSEHGSNSGAIYIFVEQSGSLVQQSKFAADDAEPNRYFGAAVAASDDTIIVGSIWDDEVAAFAGSAYAFRRAGEVWEQEVKFLPFDGVSQDFFGAVVAIDGDIAAITSLGQDAGANGAGAVYVYVRIGTVWSFSTKMVDPAPEVGGRFGHSLGVSGNRIVVGSNSTDRAQVFLKTGPTWTLETTLTAVNPPPGHIGFGTGIGISDDFLAISALHVNGHEGVLYLFKLQGGVFTFQERKDSPDGMDLGHFGWSVSMTQDRLAVGAEFSRKMFIYQRIGDLWRYETAVTSNTPSIDDGFGAIVAIGAGFAAAGTPTDKTAPHGGGSVHTFPLPSCITSIPTMGTLGIGCLAILLLGAGGFLTRRTIRG